jgi:predicted metal-dependent hydrolase
MTKASPLSSQLESIFHAAHLELKPRTPVPFIEAEFFPFAGLTHTARFRNDTLRIRVSDLFTDAPPAVVHALALILLGKLYRKRVTTDLHETYRRFILRSDIQERARNARSQRGRQPRTASPRGRWQNLDERFDRLNHTYFGGTLERPRLTWSPTKSRRILGRYDSTHRTIFVSLLFDSPDIPDYVIDYVLYHEMLHIKHPSRAENCRLITHPPEFRADEKRFKNYKMATEWIKKI